MGLIMEFTVRRAIKTNLIVRGRETFEITIKTDKERVRVVQSASPIPVTGGIPTVIDGGNF